jgi:hypothetical protein
MKHLFTFALCVLAAAAAAQPSFTSNNCFHVGAESTLGYGVAIIPYADFVNETGTNHTWDFSDNNAGGPFFSWTLPTAEYIFQSGADSDHIVFAESEINEYALTAFARDAFYSYSDDQDTLYIDGVYSGGNNYPSPNSPYLSFPLQFGDSVYTSTPLLSGNDVIGSRTRWWIYDGYGSVAFPYGTANDVYRIRTVQIDSTFIINFASRYDEMIWFQGATGIPVLRMQGYPTAVNAFYAGVDGAAVVSNNADLVEAVFPNPSAGAVQMSNAVVGNRYAVVSNMGALVHSFTAKSPNVSIDLHDLSSGVYFIRNLNNNRSVRVVVE